MFRFAFVVFTFLLAVKLSCSQKKGFTVDVSALLNPHSSAEQRRVSSMEIDRSLREYGLVVLTGIDDMKSISDNSFKSAYELFSLDLQSKQQVSIQNDDTKFGRGYLGFGDESGIAANFEPKEGYSYGDPSNSASTGRGLLGLPNRWPAGLSAQHIHTLGSLYDTDVAISKMIVQSLSELFTCEAGSMTLNEMADGGEQISLMRMFHYYHRRSYLVQDHLKQQQADEQGAHSMLGSSPHTDWGFLTVILADQVGGLQFIPRGGSLLNAEDWVDVPFIPGSVVVNGGDYLSLVSRGVYHSPIHRVLSPGSSSSSSESAAPAAADRYSFVFFFYPSYSSPVSKEVLAHCAHYLDEQQQDQEGDGSTVAEVVAAGESTYNTLLTLSEADASAAPNSFGDYVIRKWRGVYRRA